MGQSVGAASLSAYFSVVHDIFPHTLKVPFHFLGGFSKSLFSLEQNNIFLILTFLDKIIWRQLPDWHLILKTSNTPYKRHAFIDFKKINYGFYFQEIHNLTEKRKFICYSNWKTPSDYINISTRSSCLCI